MWPYKIQYHSTEYFESELNLSYFGLNLVKIINGTNKEVWNSISGYGFQIFDLITTRVANLYLGLSFLLIPLETEMWTVHIV